MTSWFDLPERAPDALPEEKGYDADAKSSGRLA
jgi:hypothetical protein